MLPNEWVYLLHVVMGQVWLLCARDCAVLEGVFAVWTGVATCSISTSPKSVAAGVGVGDGSWPPKRAACVLLMIEFIWKDFVVPEAVADA